MAQVHTRKDKIVTGLTKGVEFLFKKNKIDWIKGTARLRGQGEASRSSRATTQTLQAREGDHHRHRFGAAQRARHRDRSHADHHQRRSDPSQGDAQVARHHGQRRRRRRVRVDLPPLRQRRDDHRAAAAAGAGRRRGGFGRTREVIQEAGHQVADRHEGDQGDRRAANGVDIEAQTPDGKTQKLRPTMLLVATGRGPVTDGTRRRGARPRRSNAATSRSTSCIARRCRTSPRSAT